jgi:alpha-L-fucosidase
MMKHISILSAILSTVSLPAEEIPASPVSPAAVTRWQDARFGMFIHWEPVSLKGTEIGWSCGDQISIDEYDNLYKQFNPVKFDPDAWVAVAKAAGMKYIVLTTKHHDGFCLWNTKQTDYNIMNSPFGRDVVKELAAACKRGGIPFGTYYSTDWKSRPPSATACLFSTSRPMPGIPSTRSLC